MSTYVSLLAEAADPTLTNQRRSDDECRAMAVAYCQHRSRVRRAVEQCDLDGAPVPHVLRQALTDFIQDSYMGSMESSTLRETVPPQQSLAQQTLAAASKSTIMSLSNESLRSPGSPLNNTANSATSTTKAAPPQYGTAGVVAADFNRHTMAEHRAPLDRSSFTSEYKTGLGAAHDCKNKGDRHGEIRELTLVLERLRRDVVPDPDTTGRVLASLGDAYRAVGDLHSAETVYFDWFLLMEKNGQEPECVKALTRIGQVYHDRGDFDGARKYLLQAAERARKK
jgi:tetratricopeptide (TPR) repeat protein